MAKIKFIAFIFAVTAALTGMLLIIGITRSFGINGFGRGISGNTNNTPNTIDTIDTAMFKTNEFDKTIIFASRKYDIPLPFLIAVMRAESGFYADAVSPKGAVGLMQIMPETGETLRRNIYNPLTNIIAGAEYLHYCLKKFNNEPAPALACYNAGPASVKTIYMKSGRKFIIPPYRQTEIYILRVYNYYIYYRKLLKNGN